jgi:class 3 adenylate cyclase
MADYGVTKTDALLLFTDIVDSSVYSSILGIERFARHVMLFQSLFEELGNQYFRDKPSFEEQTVAWCQVASRGDEGIVFVVDPEEDGTELVSKAIRFAFELKARMKILHRKQEDVPPQEMKVAVGIHYGEVAVINRPKMINDMYRNPIDKILGYSINYAKRVESSSRVGRFSRVFLSKEAADLISYLPIALHKHEVPLKGIQPNEDVYEVRSAFLENVPIPAKDGAGEIEEEEFFRYLIKNLEEEDFLRDPWLKSFTVSVLSERRDTVKGTASERDYSEKIDEIAWGKLVEDDPILLYWRSRVCENEGKYSRAISCLKEIVGMYPYFIRARICLIDDCHQMIKRADKMSAEAIYVRDTAEELLEKYGGLLLDKEQQQLKEILEEIKKIATIRKE